MPPPAPLARPLAALLIAIATACAGAPSGNDGFAALSSQRFT